jgi:hypothetical protein
MIPWDMIAGQSGKSKFDSQKRHWDGVLRKHCMGTGVLGEHNLVLLIPPNSTLIIVMMNDESVSKVPPLSDILTLEHSRYI